MGLIDFVKSAGSKIFGSDAPEPSAADTAEFNKQRSQMLERAVTGLGLEIADLDIDATDDLVTLRGTAQSQEDKEKAVLVVGNHAGIARVDDQLQVQQAPPSVFHTVESGDTLSAIAKKHYGSASKYHAIFEANRPMLADPDKIYPGQVLRIPKLDD